MSKLTDVRIRAWVRAGERFEGRSDGGGLTLRFRKDDKAPVWRFRYRIAGKARVMNLGSYTDLALAEARRRAKELRAKVSLGHDVSGDKQEHKRQAIAKIEREKNAVTVSHLADKYFERMIEGRRKRPAVVRGWLEKDIKPNIGHLSIEDVKPAHIDAMLQSIVKRDAPTTANDVLQLTKKLFDHAIKHRIVQYNPAAVFTVQDAGGKESPRERSLSREELMSLFEAMRAVKGFTFENNLTVKLLLLLAVRKGELIGARVDEFDLDNAVWHLPAARTKTEVAIDIPLSPQAVGCLRELIRLGCGSSWLLPARTPQHRRRPYIHENTLNKAVITVKLMMPGVAPFTLHDLRRTARTHLAALGVLPHVAEGCLNHKIKGIEGVYNRHHYFDERRDALEKWALYLDACEKGQDWNVVPLKKKKLPVN